jgi:hypothetical protein
VFNKNKQYVENKYIMRKSERGITTQLAFSADHTLLAYS